MIREDERFFQLMIIRCRTQDNSLWIKLPLFPNLSVFTPAMTVWSIIILRSEIIDSLL